jgi:hypothetical protein
MGSVSNVSTDDPKHMFRLFDLIRDMPREACGSSTEIVYQCPQHKRTGHWPKHKNELHATNHGTVRNYGKNCQIRKYHHQQPPQTADLVAMATCYCS